MAGFGEGLVKVVAAVEAAPFNLIHSGEGIVVIWLLEPSPPPIISPISSW